jgi:hypothetical protein
VAVIADRLSYPITTNEATTAGRGGIESGLDQPRPTVVSGLEIDRYETQRLGRDIARLVESTAFPRLRFGLVDLEDAHAGRGRGRAWGGTCPDRLRG